MSTGNFLPTLIPPVTTWVQYDSTVGDLQAELVAAIPGDIQVFESQSTPGQAFIIHNGSLLTIVNPTNWINCDGNWSVNPDSDMHGLTNGGYTPTP